METIETLKEKIKIETDKVLEFIKTGQIANVITVGIDIYCYSVMTKNNKIFMKGNDIIYKTGNNISIIVKTEHVIETLFDTKENKKLLKEYVKLLNVKENK